MNVKRVTKNYVVESFHLTKFNLIGTLFSYIFAKYNVNRNTIKS